MKKRIISAIVAGLIFIPLLIIGGIYFKIAIAIIGLLTLKEIINLKNDTKLSIKIVCYLLELFMILSNINLIIKIFISVFVLLSLLIFYKKEDYNIDSCMFFLGFIIFIGSIYSYIYTIRVRDVNILIYLFLITILTDTFAYVGGKLFGKHKLAPKISPNKTIEGFLIGTSVGTVVPSIYYLFYLDPTSLLFALAFTFVLSLVGQLGDLVFSQIKRIYGIKDFSNIMPGHGGVLDRLDSIIYVIMGYIIIINLI